MFSEYSRPVDFYSMLERGICFLNNKTDRKLVGYIKEYFNNTPKTLDWFIKFKTHIENKYSDFIVSKTISFVDNVCHSLSQDYVIKIYMYDKRFGEKNIMSGEQVVSVSLTSESISLVVNSSFIDHELLHSSQEELEKRSLNYIKADLEGEIVYLDDEDF